MLKRVFFIRCLTNLKFYILFRNYKKIKPLLCIICVLLKGLIKKPNGMHLEQTRKLFHVLWCTKVIKDLRKKADRHTSNASVKQTVAIPKKSTRIYHILRIQSLRCV